MAQGRQPSGRNEGLIRAQPTVLLKVNSVQYEMGRARDNVDEEQHCAFGHGGDQGGEMAANIYIYFPAAVDGPDREGIAEELEAFFGGAAEDCGAGSGVAGFNLDYELSDGEDPHIWADRLRPFLSDLGVSAGTAFTVFPDGWEVGMEWRSVCVFGEDRRRTDDPVSVVSGITKRCP